MNKFTKVILTIEVQIILLLTIALIIKLIKLDKKHYNTSKFMYQIYYDQNLKYLNQIKDDDLIIGDEKAPISMYLYTRFDCEACIEFFINNFDKIKENFLDNGKVKLIIRFIIKPNDLEALHASICAKYAYQNKVLESYLISLASNYPSLDTTLVSKIIIGLVNDKKSFYNFVDNKTLNAKMLKKSRDIINANIRNTPTIFINDIKLVGNRRYKKIEETILGEMQ